MTRSAAAGAEQTVIGSWPTGDLQPLDTPPVAGWGGVGGRRGWWDRLGSGGVEVGKTEDDGYRVCALAAALP